MDEIDVEEILAKKASFLSKWLFVLFIIAILVLFVDNLDNAEIMIRLPYLIRICIRVLNLATSLFYCIIFFILSTKNNHYRITGIGYLLLMIYDIINMLIKDDTTVLTFFLALIALIITFVARYHEYKGHSEILYGVDEKLSDRWCKLWKWYIYIIIAMFGGMILTVIPILIVMLVGSLLLIASAIGMFVIGIIQIVYLYMTSAALKTYSKLNGSADSQLSADGL